MNVTLGYINKRINSTSSTIIGAISTTAILKDPVSRENPKLLLTGNITNKYNYMEWNGWYYWVDDIVQETQNTYWVYAHVDPLATWKAQIKNTKAFVNYSDEAHSSMYLDDPRVTCDQEYSLANQSVNLTSPVGFSGNGAVIFRTIAQTDIANQSIITYVCSLTTFSDICKDLTNGIQSDAVNWSDVKECLQNIAIKFLGAGTWSENIIYARWVPFDVSVFSDLPVTNIVRIGAYTSSFNAYYTEAPVFIKYTSTSVAIPWVGKQNDYYFLRYPKYTSISFCHPGGVMEINSPSLANQSNVYYTIGMDLFSGDYYVIVKAGYGHSEVLGVATGNVSMSVMDKTGEGFNLGQAVLKSEASIAMQSVMMAMKPVVTGKTTTTTVTGPSETYTDFADGSSTFKASKGSTKVAEHESYDTGINGFHMPSFPKHSTTSCAVNSSTVLQLYQSITNFQQQFYLQMNASIPRSMLSNDYANYIAEYGAPCNTYETLGDLTYAECVGASIQCNAPQAEKATINSYLNSGIFIED